MLMKKMAIWALAALAVFAISCKKDNTDRKESVELTSSALVGEWGITSDNHFETWVFTSDGLAVSTEVYEIEGSYKVEDGAIAFNLAKARTREIEHQDDEMVVYSEWEEVELTPEDKETIFIQAKLVYGGSVLIFDISFRGDNPEDSEYIFDMSYFLYKKGATLPSDTKPLQGTWDWRLTTPEESYIVARATFNSNKFELIIAPLGIKFTGSYTYKEGWLNCNVTAVYTAYNKEGEGDVDPITLEATWHLMELEEDEFPDNLSVPFIVDGKFAYTIIKVFPIKFEKK